MSDVEFERADAGAATTYPAQAGTLRKGGFVVIKNRPCKVVETSVSKTGKHGHAKVHVVAIDIFTGRKLEDICPSTHNTEIPFVTKGDYMLIDIEEDGFCSLMTDDGKTRDDLKCPEGEIGDEMRAAFDDGKDLIVSVQKAMGEESIISFKESNN
ncbi:Translation elongation factor IF5A [Carpediemonas membranifera]|uniref:Eukaryotic translation initiation factor 5A n=1 Tax=Carpediemonas membranifera TaxID=201153 RepID=A0A8J6BWR7_9EUKA|nr:Translation elongation factor IF5A [Carpediemonas membranifera]KAG9393835.1 Translation elongation factor IF5A [Carpediemonas membranifera]|eukprot:KAG9392706.1 Translation elongation factor IF5A [Carpediemonas membranifera]